MASNELQRVAVNSDSGIRQIQNALDILVRTLPYYNIQSLSTELTGLTPGELIAGDVNRERCLDLLTMAANVTFYLRDQNGGGGNTVLGTPPLGAAGLKALMEKLGI